MSKREAAHASSRIREDLASLLHDTVAKELVQISLSAQHIASSHPEDAELIALAELASQTSRRVRPMIMTLEADAHRQSLAEVVDLSKKMLLTRNITLEVESFLPECGVVDAQQDLIAGLVVREGATNILKYAKASTTAAVSLSTETTGTLHISMSNEVATGELPTISGGFGLRNLQYRVEEVGGQIEFIKASSQWILTCALPSQGDTHDN
ncbi:sensor histidine kinase [Arcanobacterium canis]|uniref:Histidine kinase n=1 Tax=Arcanobacterium canis TaxID=999183 RepID=A0ABY8FXB1_9ACTO|nr:histidine kinase [Arcanobacterium canis]WFM83151.1 histidine kinase [Arcanobacterium canis]